MTEQLDLEDWLRDNPKTLTEQWKKGELKEGWYYIECFDEPEHWIDLDFYRTSVYEKGVGYFSHNDWRSIAKVIAPAPSYEEWKELKDEVEIYHNNFKLMKAELERELENQQLKELLKYCHYYIINTPVYPQGDDAKQVEIHKLSDQITNAIGEKK